MGQDDQKKAGREAESTQQAGKPFIVDTAGEQHHEPGSGGDQGSAEQPQNGELSKGVIQHTCSPGPGQGINDTLRRQGTQGGRIIGIDRAGHVMLLVARQTVIVIAIRHSMPLVQFTSGEQFRSEAGRHWFIGVRKPVADACPGLAGRPAGFHSCKRGSAFHGTVSTLNSHVEPEPCRVE